MKRDSRYWIDTVAGTKDKQLFAQVEWVKVEHPFTAISPEPEVYANHNEAQNAALA